MLKPITTRELIQNLLKEVTDLEKPIYFSAAFTDDDKDKYGYVAKDDFEVNEITEQDHYVEVTLW